VPADTTATSVRMISTFRLMVIFIMRLLRDALRLPAWL
jgi:hypothetical protein